MIPFANTSITLYHKRRYQNENGKTVTVWERSVFHGCRIFAKRSLSNVGGALVVTNNQTVQISGKADIAADDVLVKGICETVMPENGVAEQLLDSPLIVKTVIDNTDAPIPHTEVTVR